MVEIVQLKWFPLIFKNVNAIYICISYWLKSFLHETANDFPNQKVLLVDK